MAVPRAPKQCGHLGCLVRVTARIYCVVHEAEHQQRLAARRGTTTQRGYGAAHQRLRASWVEAVATGTVACWRCDEPIAADEAWDLGHDDQDRSITRGPEHARRCNRRAAGQSHPRG